MLGSGIKDSIGSESLERKMIVMARVEQYRQLAHEV